MKFKLEDKTLVDDYLTALTQVEKVLWKGQMGKPTKHLEQYNPGCLPDTLLLCLFFIFAFKLSSGDTLVLLATFCVPSFMFLSSYHHRKKEKKLDFAKDQTQYILTNQRVIFVLCEKEAIQIHSIPYSNIQKVHSSRDSEGAANIYFVTNKPVFFKTFKYWSQKPHEKIVMVQVDESQQALDIIQEHLP